ncbi:MAG: carbohydrate kinase family protein [Proteobacteria bacterium]|nr:carbohydrate kinase family protein [Pseudomonadota bacterium]
MEKSSQQILAVGSGNVEYVVNLDDELQLDRKYTVTYNEHFGGSGVNYALRLTNMGIPVLPILSVGNDLLGEKIRDKILAAALKANLPEPIIAHIQAQNFFTPGINTPRTTIIVEKGRRTIFAERISRSENFVEHLKASMAELDTQSKSNIEAVMIGHVHADSPGSKDFPPGECTKHIIDSFHEKNKVFVNFGNSQIVLGIGFWEEYLQKISLFQLNHNEITAFFKRNGKNASLVDIIEWLRKKRITTLITLDKFGAIGTYKDGIEGIVLVRPYELEGFVDSTGAGDAFLSGLVSKLYRMNDFSFEDFQEAISEAGAWAAYACTKSGGAEKCPDEKSLLQFKKEGLSKKINPVEILSMKELADIIDYPENR